MKIHHILVPTDFSADAEYVLQQALVLAARDTAHVLLLHVLRRCEVMWLEGVWPTRAQIMRELQAEVEQRLQAAAAAQPLPMVALVQNPFRTVPMSNCAARGDAARLNRTTPCGHSKEIPYATHISCRNRADAL